MRNPVTRSQGSIQKLYRVPLFLIALALSYLLLPSQNVPKSITPKRIIDLPNPVSGVTVATIDGDTVLVRIEERVQRIRLIGIDTPEAVVNEKAIRDSRRSAESVSKTLQRGDKASRFTRSAIPPGTKVSITFDKKRVDNYGRILGYVYLEDGTMLNQKIVAAGFGKARSYPPNLKHQELLESAEQHARQRRLGLWQNY
jgi:micrococcal nuclease